MKIAPALPLHRWGVLVRNEVLEDRRTRGRPDALDPEQVFYRVRKAMQRPHDLAARHLGVALKGLCDQGRPVLQGHDCIDLGVQPLDLVEIGAHHLDAGNCTRGDRFAQGMSFHQNDVGARPPRPSCRRRRRKKRPGG